jgi:uncharacterized protein
MSDANRRLSDKPKRGFAAMTPEQRRAVASKGGKAAQAQGTCHRYTSETGRQAGRKGGLRAHALGRGHVFTPEEAAVAGRKGGRVRARRRQGTGSRVETDGGAGGLANVGEIVREGA